MESVRCERCGVTWLSPTHLDSVVAREVASQIRRNLLIGIRHLMKKSEGLGLPDAKAVAHHVTREPGKCQRCGAALASTGIVTCPKCRALNYNW